jgi:ParB family chromosome partitioning protein
MSRASGLGKGLDALLPDSGTDRGKGGMEMCPIDRISPNPFQPRKDIDEAPLRELADSIRENGVIQPLVVREKEDGSGYEIIAGERRWRAAQLAGLDDVPIVVREAGEQARLELAIIENIQRQDLNPLEEAMAYRQLIDDFSLTQDEVARKVGKDRSTVTNILRILQLPDYARETLAAGRMSLGHARVLLSLGQAPEAMRRLHDRILGEEMSVREAEKAAKAVKRELGLGRKPAARNKGAGGRQQEENALPDSYCRALQNDMVRALGTRVRIVQAGSRGKVEIEYYSPDDLERLMAIITAGAPE